MSSWGSSWGASWANSWGGSTTAGVAPYVSAGHWWESAPRNKRKRDDDEHRIDVPAPVLVPVARELIAGDFLRYEPPAAPGFRADGLIRDIQRARLRDEAIRLAAEDDDEVLMLLL